MGSIGVPELIIIFILALIVFGPRKLPELGRTLGKALAEFRKASTEFRSAMEQEMRELERHTQELEAKARETLEPTEQPASPPENTIGAGSLEQHTGTQEAGSQQTSLPLSVSPAVGSEELHPGEKPADGDTKPA